VLCQGGEEDDEKSSSDQLQISSWQKRLLCCLWASTGSKSNARKLVVMPNRGRKAQRGLAMGSGFECLLFFAILLLHRHSQQFFDL
jgi:hypothetical protein